MPEINGVQFVQSLKNKPFVICNKSGGNKSKSIDISLMGTVQITEGTTC